MTPAVPDEEVLEVGRRPPSKWRRCGAALTGAAALAGVGILLARQSTPNAKPPSAAIATAATATAAATTDGGVPSFVVGIATQPGRLIGYIRSAGPPGQCALVTLGRSPQHDIAAELRRAFPRYRVLDTARVLDQYTGLCILDLRARDAAGSVLVLEVVSPRRGRSAATPTVDVATEVGAARDIATVRAITSAGWQVTAGTVGPPADRPTDQQLRDFAASAALRW